MTTPNPYTASGAPAQKTNTLAIVAIILSVLGLVTGIGGLVGLVLGFISLGQIKRTGEAGHGLALASVIIGIVGIVLAIIGVIILVVIAGAASVSTTY